MMYIWAQTPLVLLFSDLCSSEKSVTVNGCDATINARVHETLMRLDVFTKCRMISLWRKTGYFILNYKSLCSLTGPTLLHNK